MASKELIRFSKSTIDALTNAAVNKYAAVATAAREAVDHDRNITVRCFAESLRAVTVCLGMAQAVLAAAIKAAKDGESVEEAMIDAAKTAADKARKARAKAAKSAAAKREVEALANIEHTLFTLGDRAKSDLLVQIEEQRDKIAKLVAELKSAREKLADLEAAYLAQQKAAFKIA